MKKTKQKPALVGGRPDDKRNHPKKKIVKQKLVGGRPDDPRNHP